MTTTLRYPLQIDGAGKAVTTSDTAQVWQDRVMVLLSTYIAERPNDLFYGTDISAALYAQVDEVLPLATTAVQSSFLRYLPDLTLNEVSVNVDDTIDNRVTLMVLFSLPDQTQVEVSTSIDASTLGLV